MSRPSPIRWLALAGALTLLGAGGAQARTTPSAALARPETGLLPAPTSSAEAQVILRCKVTSERTLEACAVASETPAGHGLGQAALDMARDVRINAETFKPEMVGRTLDIPIRFAEDAPAEDETGVAKMPM